MPQTSPILEHGKSTITKTTATSIGRIGIPNKAGIDIRAYYMLLRGNLASGISRGRAN